MVRFRFALLAACLVSLAPGARAAPPDRCTPLNVAVTQTDPMRATLSWARSPGAFGYFVQYSTGKFPTQETITPADGETAPHVEIYGLTPGRSYTIELCEGFEPGACPAGPASNACVTLVEVKAATAWPDAVQPDPSRAVCAFTPGVAIMGETTGAPDGGDVVAAETADACCSACAAAESWRPYTAACTHFIFDPTARQCYLRRERLGETPAPGAVSGQVRAWPRP